MSGAIVAVVFGLAAQQTLGNLIAGVVLISARPFKVGDRVRLQSGHLAGELEGVVASLGLLYTTFARGEDSIMVPNNIVLAAAVVPLREPSAVDLRARLRPDVMPSQVQELLEEGIRTPVRAEPHIGLEEIDKDEVVVRIAATPAADADGPRLADEILAAIAPITREGQTEERLAARLDDEDGRARRDRPAPAAGPAGPRHAGVRVLAVRAGAPRSEDGRVAATRARRVCARRRCPSSTVRPSAPGGALRRRRARPRRPRRARRPARRDVSAAAAAV